MWPQGLLRKMGVRVIFTTDDPADDLYYHKIAKETIDDIVFLPCFRPDAYCDILMRDGEITWKKYAS